MTAATFYLDAAPRNRCGHIDTARFPVIGAVNFRCWENAGVDGVCDKHRGERAIANVAEQILAEVRASVFCAAWEDDWKAQPTPGATYLCPAPTSAFFACRRELPCTSHDVPNPVVGNLIYGSTLARVPGRRRPIRFKKA